MLLQYIDMVMFIVTYIYHDYDNEKDYQYCVQQLATNYEILPEARGNRLVVF